MLATWPLMTPKTPTAVPRTVSIRSAAEQLDNFLREGRQLQTDADRIERELLFLQLPSPTPSEIHPDRFPQDVQSLESEIQETEAHFSREHPR